MLKLVREVADSEHVTEATVLSTCNRTEVYADVDRFHGSVESISRLFGERAGAAPEDLLGHLYVHYDDGAVSHLFHVAAGLDSMVLGESQILGQTREALRVGQELGTIGPALNVLFQQALRVGKRSHAETDIDRVAPSLVGAALDRAAEHVGDLAGKHVVVVGAGSMASLTVADRRARRCRLDRGRQPHPRARRPAWPRSTTPARSRSPRWPTSTGPVDVLVSCTGAAGVLIDVDARLRRAARATARSPSSTSPCRTTSTPPWPTSPASALIALDTLAAELEDTPGAADVDGVRTIVAQELAAFLTARRSQSVTPTVVALRTMATGVVDAELARLVSRLPELDDATPRRGREDHPPGRREAAPPADRARQGAGQRRRARSPTPPRSPSCSRSTPRPSRP